jgi:hypothetical protein
VLTQRAALVELGAEALRRSDYQGFVDEAVRLAAAGAETPMAKLVQRLDDGRLLLVSAWNLKPGFVGRIVGTDDPDCPPSEALSGQRVVVVEDVRGSEKLLFAADLPRARRGRLRQRAGYQPPRSFRRA